MIASRKVQSLQKHTGFECAEVVPTSPSNRAVVHPVSSPIGCVMIRSLPAHAGRLPVSSGVAQDFLVDLATRCRRPAHDHWTILAKLGTAYKPVMIAPFLEHSSRRRLEKNSASPRPGRERWRNGIKAKAIARPRMPADCIADNGSHPGCVTDDRLRKPIFPCRGIRRYAGKPPARFCAGGAR
jgi:hypothetical protein